MKTIYILFFILISSTLFSQSGELDSLKSLLKTSKEDTNKAKIFLQLSEICDEKDILKYAEEGLRLSEKLNFKKGIAGCLNNIGYANHAVGNNTEALENWNKSLKIFEEINDIAATAPVLNNIGFIYERQGLTEKSLDCYLKALKIREKINDKVEIANSLNNLALLYNTHGESEKSLELNLKNLKIQKEINDELGLGLTLNNIALNYYALGDQKKGLDYLFESLNLRIKIKDSMGISDSYINIGTSYFDNQQYDSAIYYTEIGYKIKSRIQDKNGEASATYCIANAYFKMNNNVKAEKYALISFKLSNELGFPNNIKVSSSLLSQIYREEGKYQQAYDMYVIFKQMSDSVTNLSIKNSMVKKQMQYDFDKKEEITQLEQKKKDELAKEEKRIQQIITLSVVIGLAVVLVFSIFIFRSLQKNKKANRIITLQKIEVEKQKEIVEHQKELVEEHQKEILDSINYAKRIQYTLLAHADFLKENLPEHFVFFNPKDIVSGDFYWATEKNNKFYIAVCDSTGHGVPGAFMSLLNIGFLSEAINEKDIFEPNEVFNYVRKRLTDSISKEGQKDGFDGILVCFDKINNVITYAAANNAPILVRNGELIDLDADKMPVGVGERKQDFTLRTLEYKKDDILYLYTDGYADQFGGPKGKKFKYKPLNEMIVANAPLPLEQQAEVLNKQFFNWKGDLEQVDDVLIIGIKL